MLYVQVDYTKRSNKYIKTNIYGFEEYSKQNKLVEIKLNAPGRQAMLYNINDMKITNYIVTEDEKNRPGYGFKY